jgi:hypothetical protein
MMQGLEKPIAELTAVYRSLGPAARCGIWALLAFELVLIVAVERDIQRRPAERVRGPKLLWRAAATQNVIGSAAYLALGRRGTR